MVGATRSEVVLVADVSHDDLASLLQKYELCLVVGNDGEPITGSYWGDSEAGIVGTTVYVRADTPVHSLLHETCHVVCMTNDRRKRLHRDAGGDDLEEAAVCYLQVILADRISGVGRKRMTEDMDAWGYSFRLGNTLDWFEQDADDAREFLINQRLLTCSGRPTFELRS